MDRSDVVYFEDVEIGVEYVSPGRTITTADIANYAGVTGDFSEMHVNADLMSGGGDRSSRFGSAAALHSGVIAHGLLGLAVQDALSAWVMPRTAGLAFLGVNWNFRKPIRPGDTLYVHFHVKEKRPSRSRPGTGVLTWSRTLVNQDGETVQDGETFTLVQCRPST